MRWRKIGLTTQEGTGRVDFHLPRQGRRLPDKGKKGRAAGLVDGLAWAFLSTTDPSAHPTNGNAATAETNMSRKPYRIKRISPRVGEILVGEPR